MMADALTLSQFIGGLITLAVVMSLVGLGTTYIALRWRGADFAAQHAMSQTITTLSQRLEAVESKLTSEREDHAYAIQQYQDNDSRNVRRIALLEETVAGQDEKIEYQAEEIRVLKRNLERAEKQIGQLLDKLNERKEAGKGVQ